MRCAGPLSPNDFRQLEKPDPQDELTITLHPVCTSILVLAFLFISVVNRMIHILPYGHAVILSYLLAGLSRNDILLIHY